MLYLDFYYITCEDSTIITSKKNSFNCNIHLLSLQTCGLLWTGKRSQEEACSLRAAGPQEPTALPVFQPRRQELQILLWTGPEPQVNIQYICYFSVSVRGFSPVVVRIFAVYILIYF